MNMQFANSVLWKEARSLKSLKVVTALLLRECAVSWKFLSVMEILFAWQFVRR